MKSDEYSEDLRYGPQTKAIICDLDGTICNELIKPIAIACEVLKRIDCAIEVHYVTGRPLDCREWTEKFLADHQLPCKHNLHLCPEYTLAREHKADVIRRLSQEYRVLVSIGDSLEEELASDAVGIRFIRVDREGSAETWNEIARLICNATKD